MSSKKMADLDSKILMGAIGLFAAVYGWIMRHLFSKAQFKDVCSAKHKGLDDCLESEMKRNTERYEALDKKIDKLTDIVLNGGHSKPRVTT